MSEMTLEQKAAAYDAWQQEQQAARADQPQQYAGPAGAGQLAAPVQPPPPAEPPREVATPHPGESFAPAEMGFYSYQHPADPPGQKRTQVVLVTHVDDSHVHGLVMGELRNLASFLAGELTHAIPGAAAQ